MLAQPYPWQTSIWQDWLNQLAVKPLPHAILLSGASGLGKLNLAQSLATFLLCQQPNYEQGTACAECPSCKLLQSGFHPDLYLLEAEEKSKNIRVNQIRTLNQEVQKSAQLGGYKLVLIYPAESLNINAANALLKTLEEPEPKTQFILVSHQPSALPATIRSRCQNWQIKTPAAILVLDWLRQQLGDKSDQAEILLRAANNQPLTAVQLANPEVEEARQLLAQSLTQLFNGANPLEIAAQLKKVSLETCLNWLQATFADSVKLAISGIEALAETRQLELNKLLNQQLSPKQLLQLDRLIMQKKPYLANNPNQEIFLETLLIEIQEAARKA